LFALTAGSNFSLNYQRRIQDKRYSACRCDRSIYNVPSGSIMFGHKDGLMFIYGPETD